MIKALRQTRAAYRAADTAGEKEERELDRLIKRKTRMNANQLATLNTRYLEYLKKCTAIQVYLRNANEVASNF